MSSCSSASSCLYVFRLTRFLLAAGEAAIMSASFTVEKNSSRIEVPDVFTLQRSNVAKAAPAAASSSAAAGTAPAGSGRVSRSTQESPEAAVVNRPADGAPVNVLRVTLHPAGAGNYPSKVVLISGDDVRVLDVEFSAVKTGQQVTLEFNTSARERLVQEVLFAMTLLKVCDACIGLLFAS